VSIVRTEQAEQNLPNTIWQKTRERFEIHFKPEHQTAIVEIPAPQPTNAPQAPIERAEKSPRSSVAVKRNARRVFSQ
jgi:hypothetical protein